MMNVEEYNRILLDFYAKLHIEAGFREGNHRPIEHIFERFVEDFNKTRASGLLNKLRRENPFITDMLANFPEQYLTTEAGKNELWDSLRHTIDDHGKQLRKDIHNYFTELQVTGSYEFLKQEKSKMDNITGSLVPTLGNESIQKAIASLVDDMFALKEHQFQNIPLVMRSILLDLSYYKNEVSFYSQSPVSSVDKLCLDLIMSNVESSLVNGWKGKAEQLEANRDLESGQAKWLKLATEKLPKEVEEIIAQNKEFQARQEETTTPRVKRSK